MGFIGDKTRFFNPNLAAACSLIAVSSFNYGFDNQAFATTQAMDAFDRQFGVYSESKKTYVLPPGWLSLFNSLNYIGFAAGVIIGSYVSRRWGRRMCMFVMSIYALGTATVAITSRNKDQIMAARILNYVYVGMELAVVPAYQSEIVPAPVRGLIVGTYQFSLILGGLIINCVCLGTSRIPGNRSWQIPIGLFYIIPTLIASAIWLVSSRDASKTRVETEQGRFWDIFRSPHRKRTLLVVGINFFQQATGQQFASQFGALYAKQLGTIDPFVFSLVVACINALAIALSLLTNDRVGRRMPLLLSACIMCTGLLAMGGLGTPRAITDGLKMAIVSMLCLMTFGFSLGFAPLCYVVSTELPPLHLRDATLRLGFFTNVLFNFVSNFILPYCLDALSSKTGFVFGSVSFLSILFVYFCVPECKGKTLEQVDQMFKEGVPLRRFGDYDAPTHWELEEEKAGDKSVVQEVEN
ncbi:hypothetical protein VTK73DRAFT_2895 [Phialemonium thermophilum]|uniref:Major facilitator superfamily (MFS) profile domain-containing protein n=1 Tax=Phialemonium thermophilum TaxID=223376 RepID=A0ABR3X2W1_9PEZI